LSYASKRDCASIAPHTKLKQDIANIYQPPFFGASGRDKTLAAERFLIFLRPKTKTKKLKFEDLFLEFGQYTKMMGLY
jgi:hypothetical protein